MRRIPRKRAILAATAVLASAFASTVGPTRALDRVITRKVQPASVQLGPLYSVIDKQSGKRVYGSFPLGSGTILSPDGYILTNAHVVDLAELKEDAKKNNAEIVDGVMVVSMTKRSDEPPIPVFLAKILAEDINLDIAVVKISTNLNGQAINPSEVSFPWVPLGDSDTVELGDTLNIFGYPGIGGATITYTSGPVSGFASDPNFKGRAWIKTSASISGGNSGGTGVDDDGKLIGIPTRGGVEGANGIVDCRPLADTNRDGKVDNSDTCVPSGGFINSLRTINAAKALITKTMGNSSPNPSPTPTPTPTPNPSPTPTPLPEPTPQPQPTTTVAPQPAPQPTPQPSTQDVAITGYLIDAVTGRPLVGGWFFVLAPGVKWGTANLTEDDIVATLKTDRNGYFAHPQLRLVRGQSYAMGASMDGYKGVSANDIAIPTSSEDPLVITIKLDPK